jgi:hypothetical protein
VISWRRLTAWQTNCMSIMREMSPKSAYAEKPNSSKPIRKPRIGANYMRNSKPSPKKIDPLVAARRKLDDLGIVGAPKITQRMITAAGGRQGVLAALECDDSDEAIAFMEVYRSFSEEERDTFSLEELFLLAGMTARRFGEVLMGALMQQGADASRLLISVAMPEVSEALIKAATERTPILDNTGNLVGYSNPDMKAVEIFGKISRMLPIPKGSKTIINVGNQNDSEDEESAELEPMDDFLMELQTVTRNQLPAPKTIDVPRNTKDLEYKFSEV